MTLVSSVLLVFLQSLEVFGDFGVFYPPEPFSTDMHVSEEVSVSH